MSQPQPIHFHAQPGWKFYNPVKLTVGRGCRQALVEALANQTLLIVTTQRGRRQLTEDALLGALVTQNRVLWVDSVRENPGLTDLQAEIDRLQGEAFDAVIAFGGGSAMDAAKALNVALAPECRAHSLQTLLVDPARHAGARPRPLYTVTTTSGTGSEVTPFATVWHHEIKKKLSLAGPAVWPTAAFVDAALTDSVPLSATISTGLDAINQAAESLWNRNANPITLGYAIRALQLGFAALPPLARGEGGEAARDQMAEASLLAGLAISHTRTALCHSMSYPITAHFGVPHGLACAFTMPAVLRHNLQAEDGRFAQVALALTGSSDPAGLVACFDQLHETMRVRERVMVHIPRLDALLALESEMFTPGRADNNLVDVTTLTSILEAAWGE
ncbi:phosphonoacetaldehyde reductase [Ectothiorhodospira shaposhnikovii]|uniref:phosphonoacetaldehyde reductase n=1 Tax=Ectothiorhodospira shaposhnikovii TaxID=1054 RepID=UPI00399FE36A